MEGPIVEIAEGKVRGFVKKNLDDEEFYCFLAVPYAKPPLGELRFKAPEPVEPWIGIKDATKEGPGIYCKDTFTGITSGSEDGLHLNIFTKKTMPQDSKLNPVMVFIHGGAFKEGSNNSENLGPDFLLLEDIVLVYINYRTGFLGFMQFEDPSLEVFGNAGMKDQVAALKWVQRNIRNFGGDPDNVTIFGESAGGAAVEYLILSPSAKGLFHKAISQSGTTANMWAQGKKFTKDLFAYLDKDGIDEKDGLEYLRNLSVEELYQVQQSFLEAPPSDILGVLGPIVENHNSTAFMTKKPIDYIINGDYNKVPFLLGYNSSECLFFGAATTSPTDMSKMADFEHNISKIINVDKNSDVCKTFCSKLKNIYGDTELSTFNFMSDVLFIADIIDTAKKLAKTSDKPVYLYRMNLDAGLNLLKMVTKVKGPGALHADELGYLFKNTILKLEKGSPEETYVRRFVKLWTNFAKYGNPTPDISDLGVIWEPIKEGTVYFLDIDQELTLQNDPEKERMTVWNEILQAKYKSL